MRTFPFLDSFIRINLALVFVGLFLNIIVVHENGGKMPVLSPDYFGLEGLTLDSRHIVAHRESSLLFLSDWIHLDMPEWSKKEFKVLYVPVIASPGDIFMRVCILLSMLGTGGLLCIHLIDLFRFK